MIFLLNYYFNKEFLMLKQHKIYSVIILKLLLYFFNLKKAFAKLLNLKKYLQNIICKILIL